MDNFFYLPDDGNFITIKDLDAGILRITVGLKSFFPKRERIVNLVIGGISYQVVYENRQSRSDRLYLGKELIEALKLRAGDRLKFTKATGDLYVVENNFIGIRENETDNISFEQLILLRKKYWQLLEKYPFPIPPNSGECVDMLRYFKRTNKATRGNIGPYSGITVFEAANRIASDLVIINGIIQIIGDGLEPEESLITVRLGNKHIKNKGDFTINNKEGEAFNVAPSFYNGKISMTNSKWKDVPLAYILVNAEVFEGLRKRHGNNDKRVIKVRDWDIKIV